MAPRHTAGARVGVDELGERAAAVADHMREAAEAEGEDAASRFDRQAHVEHHRLTLPVDVVLQDEGLGLDEARVGEGGVRTVRSRWVVGRKQKKKYIQESK